MALIAMAVYSTEENGKDDYLNQTCSYLKNTVDFTKHRMFFSINAKTNYTKGIINQWLPHSSIQESSNNIGTAEAINKCWHYRVPGENCIKMDDDVIIHHQDWIYLMEEAIRRDPKIGQVGLKRRDLVESPWNTDSFYQSSLEMLPHQPGEKWITIENVNHVMGTCVMHSSALLDKIGYLKQPKLYGFDDSLASLRSRLAGFKNVFLTAVDIEHIDPGTSPFQKWKENHASECWKQYHEIVSDYQTGKESLYYNPFKK